jgi:Putative prokaryotic signal transducing protein
VPDQRPLPQQTQFAAVPAASLLRRYRDLPDAVVAKSILDSEGIDCVLSDENLVRMDWFWSGLLGGVKLWVRQQDLAQAQDLISQRTPDAFQVEGVGEYVQPRCPRCQSADVSFKGLNRPVAFITTFFGLPIPLKRRGWKCRSCGYSWPDSTSFEKSTSTSP